jgi:hypothetical protein
MNLSVPLKPGKFMSTWPTHSPEYLCSRQEVIYCSNSTFLMNIVESDKIKKFKLLRDYSCCYYKSSSSFWIRLGRERRIQHNILRNCDCAQQKECSPWHVSPGNLCHNTQRQPCGNTVEVEELWLVNSAECNLCWFIFMGIPQTAFL